ncbi:hypothetical protein [Phytohabitans suffuscus]|uniref:Uncharacterized protein n=1 Tax=Phytohabitans suffuscus TaxID=624315 RepID=A0A6F8YBV5_9ACTN|nr:hypothetical protein [Phytohabitans suffuscus]BCB83614.1 hypothetical protein Psuf_009270 [Phytohabitans suffuscus]
MAADFAAKTGPQRRVGAYLAERHRPRVGGALAEHVPVTVDGDPLGVVGVEDILERVASTASTASSSGRKRAGEGAGIARRAGRGAAWQSRRPTLPAPADPVFPAFRSVFDNRNPQGFCVYLNLLTLK